MPRFKMNVFLISENTEGEIFTNEFKMICFVRNSYDDQEVADRAGEITNDYILNLKIMFCLALVFIQLEKMTNLTIGRCFLLKTKALTKSIQKEIYVI